MPTAQVDNPPDLLFSLLSFLASSPQVTRASLVTVLQECCTEESVYLLTLLGEAWKTIDLLQEEFGTQNAVTLLLCELYRERYSPYLDKGG